MFGYKRVYVGGFVLFTLGGVLCGISQSIAGLVGLRVLQGIGAGMIQAVGPAIVTAVFASDERGKALGINAMSVALGLSLGPILGGMLTEWFAWRWVFFVNLPVGLLGIFWALRVLPDARKVAAQRFDAIGGVLVSVALLCLLLAITEGESWGWASVRTLALLAAFAVLGALFVMAELKVGQPLLDLRLFAIRPFSAGNASLLIAFAALFTTIFLLPFFLERAQGRSALEAGLLLTPLPLAILVVAPLSGAFSDKLGSRILSPAGLAVLAAGLLSLTQLSADAQAWDVVWRLALIGTGMGLFNSPNQSVILGSVPATRLGIASGMVAQMRLAGQALGVAVGTAVFASRLTHHTQAMAGTAHAGFIEREAFILALHDVFYVAAAICVVGILTSLARHEKGDANQD